MQIKIVKASVDHISSIAAFQVQMAFETEEMQLEKSRVLAGVKKFFHQPERGFYLVAQVPPDKIAGCILVQKEWSDWRNREVWWLHSVYVLPAYRKLGIFRRFFKQIEALAQENDIAAIRLYVEKNNVPAQKVYEKLGMNNQHYELFEKMLI